MSAAARVYDPTSCPLHGVGQIQAPASLDTVVNSRGRVRLGDFVLCTGGILDVIVTGSATVLANGLPVARVGDHTAHGARITQGSPDVDVGGPTFALPSVFKVEGEAAFKQMVLRDLYFLSTLPSGKGLIHQLDVAGHTVTFQLLPNNEQNSYCASDHPLLSKLGIGTSSTILYNPQIDIVAYDPAGNRISFPPQLVLGHEMRHALANSTGTQKYGEDAQPYPSEPHMEEEEAQAIGSASHSNTSPNENSFRRDLGLAERGNHFGKPRPATFPKPPNLRPGGP